MERTARTNRTAECRNAPEHTPTPRLQPGHPLDGSPLMVAQQARVLSLFGPLRSRGGTDVDVVQRALDSTTRRLKRDTETDWKAVLKGNGFSDGDVAKLVGKKESIRVKQDTHYNRVKQQS